jgi:hypothetical protein
MLIAKLQHLIFLSYIADCETFFVVFALFHFNNMQRNESFAVNMATLHLQLHSTIIIIAQSERENERSDVYSQSGGGVAVDNLN